jgi:hypothetical protein
LLRQITPAAITVTFLDARFTVPSWVFGNPDDQTARFLNSATSAGNFRTLDTPKHADGY